MEPNSNNSKVSCSRKQWGPLRGLELTTDTLRVRHATHCATRSRRPLNLTIRTARVSVYTLRLPLVYIERVWIRKKTWSDSHTLCKCSIYKQKQRWTTHCQRRSRDTAISPREGIITHHAGILLSHPGWDISISPPPLCASTLPYYFFMTTITTTITKVQLNKLHQTTIIFRIIDGTICFNNAKI